LACSFLTLSVIVFGSIDSVSVRLGASRHDIALGDEAVHKGSEVSTDFHVTGDVPYDQGIFISLVITRAPGKNIALSGDCGYFDGPISFGDRLLGVAQNLTIPLVAKKGYRKIPQSDEINIPYPAKKTSSIAGVDTLTYPVKDDYRGFLKVGCE